MSVLLPVGSVRVTDRVVGSGASHVILEATYINRPVVAKRVINPASLDLAAADEEFEKEWEVLSHLDHACIVKAFGLWRSPDTDLLHLICERVPGVPLEWVIKVCQVKRRNKGARHWDTITREMVLLIGDALAHMHRRAVYHNDLKPDNILVHLTQDGVIRVKLIDFDSTGEDCERGKFQYAAPERMDGQKASSRSDIYGFGVLIYRLLTGTLPFRHATRAESRKARDIPIAESQDPVNQQAWKWISRWPQVAEALSAALDPDPKKRPQDVPAFLGRLGLTVSGPRLSPSFGFAALAGLVAAAVFVWPMSDSVLSRKLLTRLPLSACMRSLGCMAEKACAATRPGVETCVDDLLTLASPAECFLRAQRLRDCVDVSECESRSRAGR